MRQAQAAAGEGTPGGAPVRSSRHVSVGLGAVDSMSSSKSEEELLKAKQLEDARHRSRDGGPRLVEDGGGGGGGVAAATALYGPGNKYRLGVREPRRMTAELRARERAQADKVSDHSENRKTPDTRAEFSIHFFFPRLRSVCKAMIEVNMGSCHAPGPRPRLRTGLRTLCVMLFHSAYSEAKHAIELDSFEVLLLLFRVCRIHRICGGVGVGHIDDVLTQCQRHLFC